MANSRQNAKQKVTGIAAAFGGAKETFLANVNKNAGPEAAAMGKKDREQKQAENNFGNKDKANPQDNSRQNAKSSASFTPSAGTSSKTKPSDGSEFETAVKPVVGDAAAFAGNVGITKNPEQNSKSVNTGINPAKRGPSDGGSIAPPKLANDNQLQQDNDPNKANNQAPASQRGGAPVVPNPTAVSKETQSTLSPEIAKLLNTQGQVNRNQDRKSGEFDEDEEEGNRNFELENLQQQQENLFLQNQFEEEENEDGNREKFIKAVKIEFEKKKIQMTDEEIMSLVDSNFKVKFPMIMFSLTVMAELGDLVLGLVGVVLTFILPPVGLIIDFMQIFVGFIFTVSFFLWNNYYAKNASDYSNKVSFVRRLIWKFAIRRSWAMAFKWIPIIGELVPINSILVILTYRYMKKVTRDAEKIYQEKRGILNG